MTRQKTTPVSEPFTDLGNARRFVAHNNKEIRYCAPWGKWLVWDGKRWAIDETGVVERRVKNTVRGMYAEASAVKDSGDREDFVRHALGSESVSRIHAIISLAETEEGIPITPRELDQNPLLLNCRNGTVDLRTGTLRPHCPADVITKMAPVDFDPRATCPKFDAFIDKIMGGDSSLVRYVQRCIGYALTGDVSAQAMFVLHGSGANGKTTLLEAIRYLLGEYAGQVPVRTLMTKRGDSISNDIAQLKGLRFVTSSEVEAGQRMAEAQVKQLTGGGTLQARFLYHEPFQFEPTHKLFMDCNHKPVIRGTDEAIWRRIKLVPFNVSIPEAERDGKLLGKLKGEAAGIFAWAVRGCVDWQCDGLNEPPTVAAATGEYRDDMDLVKRFVEEECTLDLSGHELVENLHNGFAGWCGDLGEEPLTKKAFGLALKDINGLTRGKFGGERCWDGIRLNSPELNKKAA